MRNLVAKLYQSVRARNFTDVNVQLGNKGSVFSEVERGGKRGEGDEEVRSF
ncbi:hypothetical protein IIC38_17905 [candidate division KSB1 bacterium]|nr:hypothetical protein [candidate division KSB1 bacterium]